VAKQKKNDMKMREKWQEFERREKKRK